MISGYSLLKGIGDGEPIASDRFTVGGHEWVLLFYPDGKRSTSDPNAPSPADDPYAALFVALIGEGPRPQGVVTSVNGRVVRAFHRFTLVDQSAEGTTARHITKGRQRDQGAVKISCARQDPNARNCHGYRKFVRRSVLESPNNGYLKDDTIVFRYEIELVVTSGGALNRPKQLAPAIDVGAFPTLGDQIRTLLTEDADKTDVVFEVEGERFPAHSLVVAARSSAFRAMLRTGAEMREGSEGIIRIGDVRAPVFRALLQFLYSDELPDGTGRNTSHEFSARRGDAEDTGKQSEASARRRAFANRGGAGPGAGGAASSLSLGNANASSAADTAGELDVAMTQHLLVAADRFDLTRLRAMCEAKLCDTVEVETAATTLALAEQNHALALKQACLQFVASHLGEVMLTEGYKHMEQSCPNLAGELLKTVAQQNQAAAAAAAAAAANAALPEARLVAAPPGPGPAPPGPGAAAAAPALPPPAAAEDLFPTHSDAHDRRDAYMQQANAAMDRIAASAAAAAAAGQAAAGGQAAAAAASPDPDPSRGGDVAATRERSPRGVARPAGLASEASQRAAVSRLGLSIRPPTSRVGRAPHWETMRPLDAAREGSGPASASPGDALGGPDGGIPTADPRAPARSRRSPEDSHLDDDGDEPPPTDSDLDDVGAAIPPGAPPATATAFLDARHPARRSRAAAPRGAAAPIEDDAEDADEAAGAAARAAVGAGRASRAAGARPATRGAGAASPDAEDGANATTGRRVRRRTGGEA